MPAALAPQSAGSLRPRIIPSSGPERFGWANSCPTQLRLHRPKRLWLYSPRDMQLAMNEVDGGVSVKLAAEKHGIPLRSLYHRLKCRSEQLLASNCEQRTFLPQETKSMAEALDVKHST